MNMSENDVHVCQSLPEKLRPKSLTVFIDKRIVEGAKVVENTDLCDQVVEMARFHQHIQLGLLRYLEADHSCMKVQVNIFSTEIGRILTSLELRVARQFRSVGFSSTSTTRNKLTDKQKLDESRKKICEDLREVWTVSKENFKTPLST